MREINAQLTALKDNAIKQAKAELDKATGGLTEQFSSFSDIQKQITGQSSKIADYRKSLDTKLADLQNSAKAQADEQVRAAATQAEERAREAASNAIQNLIPGRR
jgi:hypothetical protein